VFSSIAAVITEQGFADLGTPLARLAVPDVPIPYNISLMNAVVPEVRTLPEKSNPCWFFEKE